MIKHNILTPILFLALFNCGSAQGKYISVSAGNAYSFRSEALMSETTVYGFNDLFSPKDMDSKPVILSLGRGLNYQISFGYMMNKYLALELGAYYSDGTTCSGFVEYGYNTIEGNWIEFESYRTKVESSFWGLTPQFVLMYPLNHRLKPIVKFGPIFGEGLISVEKTSSKSNTIFTKTNMSDGLDIGMCGSFILEYKLNNRWNVYGEFNVKAISVTPRYGKLVKYELNGEDRIEQLSVKGLEIEYIDNYIQEGLYVPEDEPLKAASVTYPFSSMGFNVGVKMDM